LTGGPARGPWAAARTALLHELLEDVADQGGLGDLADAAPLITSDRVALTTGYLERLQERLDELAEVLDQRAEPLADQLQQLADDIEAAPDTALEDTTDRLRADLDDLELDANQILDDIHEHQSVAQTLGLASNCDTELEDLLSTVEQHLRRLPAPDKTPPRPRGLFAGHPDAGHRQN